MQDSVFCPRCGGRGTVPKPYQHEFWYACDNCNGSGLLKGKAASDSIAKGKAKNGRRSKLEASINGK